MSLIVWCPLISDLHNQGISSTNLSGGGSIVSSGGKLASTCFHLTAAGTWVTISQLVDKQAFSICCWVKIVTSETFTNWADCWTVEANADGSVLPCRLERANTSSTTNLGWYVARKDNSAPLYNIGSTTSNGVWVHTVLTYDGTNAKSYANGTLVTTVAKSSFATSFKLTGRVRLGDSNSATYLQDFRIYDKALSEIEIKELSKGLVAHYTLGPECAEGAGLVNLYTGDSTKGYGPYTEFVRTKHEDYTNYTFSYTGTGSNRWASIRWDAATTTPTIGSKYVWSCMIRINSISSAMKSVGMQFRNALVVNDYTDGGVSIFDAQIGKWTTFTTTFTIPQKCAQGNVDPTPMLEFMTGNMNSNGTSYTFDIDITETAIYKSDYVCTTVPPSKFSNIVYDSSGYCHNGTISGIINCSTDTVRYKSCVKFNGSNYISCTSPTAEAKTLSLWAYIGSAIPTSSEVLFADYKSKLSLGFYNSGTLIITRCAGTGSTIGAVTLVKLNSWNHFCVVNGSSNKLYINGEEASMSGSNEWTHQTDTLMIGARSSGTGFTNKISDVRLYATALSAADVTALYKLGLV